MFGRALRPVELAHPLVNASAPAGHRKLMAELNARGVSYRPRGILSQFSMTVARCRAFVWRASAPHNVQTFPRSKPP